MYQNAENAFDRAFYPENGGIPAFNPEPVPAGTPTYAELTPGGAADPELTKYLDGSIGNSDFLFPQATGLDQLALDFAGADAFDPLSGMDMSAFTDPTYYGDLSEAASNFAWD
jgi:hypothetical protein